MPLRLEDDYEAYVTNRIQVVQFFGADGRVSENRAILVGNSLFRSVDDLVDTIETMAGSPKPSFVIYNPLPCDPESATFSDEEITAIFEVCKKMDFDCKLAGKQPNQPLQTRITSHTKLAYGYSYSRCSRLS